MLEIVESLVAMPTQKDPPIDIPIRNHKRLGVIWFHRKACCDATYFRGAISEINGNSGSFKFLSPARRIWFSDRRVLIKFTMTGGGGFPMFDAQTTALLRSVLDEVCDGISRYETGVRAHVASQILEAARQGEITIDGLRQVGIKALMRAPTMWR